ncbi:MAG: hypothetical protein ACRD9S_02265 [Pyrinomonadaceae bacterium]
MYCSSCGAAVGKGLSYCKNCGAKSPGAIAKPSELFPDSLVWAIVTIFVVGLGSIIGLAALMKKLFDSSSEVINVVILLGFLLMIAIEAVFIWLLLRQKSAMKKAHEIEQPTKTTKELYEPPARVLTEGAIPSVTEHTTRSFEPIHSERKSE